jgi:CHAT domain-containing protein/tetratricopeptide (TPR) repeat protein
LIKRDKDTDPCETSTNDEKNRMTLKPLGFKFLCVYASAMFMSFSVAQEQAQGFPFPIPGDGTQGNQANCEQLAILARQGVAPLPGMDLNTLMAMAGCTPLAAAPRPDAGAVIPESEVQAPRQRRSTDETCRLLSGGFDTSHSNPGFWLGPMAVVSAIEEAERCRGARDRSLAQQHLQDGLLRFGEGRFGESADVFREGVSQADSDGMRTRLLAEMGKSLLAAGRAEEAHSAFEQALGMAEKGAAPAQDQPRRTNPGRGANLQEILEQGQRETERTDAVDAMAQMQTELLILVGLAHLQTNNVARAIERLREANALMERRGEKAASERSIVSPYLALALQRAGRYEEARTLLEGALTGREEALGMMGAGPRMMETMSQALGMMGMGNSMAGQKRSLGRNMEVAGMMSGELSLPSFACPLLEQIHVQGNAPEQALEAAERCRARALTQLLANRAFHKPLPSIQEMAATQRRLGVGPANTLDESRRAFLDNPQAEAASRPATMADMRRMAAERGATVVVYSISYTVNWLPNRMPDRETGILIWVVNPDGRVAMRQRSFKGVLSDDTYALTAAVLHARKSFGAPGRGPTAAVAARKPQVTRASAELRRLYQVLIEPVADLLPDKEGARVMFVPQGALFLVPFAALENTAGAPLIARYTVSVTPSMQTLALTAIRKQMSRATGPALIVGNPAMPRYSPAPGKPDIDIPELPGAEEEAKAIGDLLKASPLTGAAATKSAVMRQAREARYIHLATHGFLDDLTERAQESANPHVRKMAMLGANDESHSRTPGMLALAPSGSDSGMLTADEIAESTTHAELVVMSACDSGRGEINDEGVIGLSRAWMAAGAPSVIVSLWAIPDESTRDLMVEFYRRLAAGGGKAEALREAMLATRAKYPNPEYWAAFVLLGEPD